MTTPTDHDAARPAGETDVQAAVRAELARRRDQTRSNRRPAGA